MALQIEYGPIQRTPERELLPMARSLDLAVTPWGIPGSGALTGKYNQAQPPKEGRVKEGRGQDPEVLAREHIRNLTHAGCSEKIDNHRRG